MDHTSNATTAPLETLGPPWQIFFIIVYSLTAVIAFVLNLLTIIVLVKGHRCTRDLRQLLLNLAIADLFMSMTTIPFTYTNYMFGRWIFPSIMCPLVNVAQLTTITASIWLLVVIAIDRYFAILHPLKHSNSSFKRHCRLIVVFVWLFGICIGITQIWVTKVSSFIYNGATYISCGERWLPESPEGQLYTGFIFIITFALPMLLLCIVHTAMGCRLVHHQVPGQRDCKKKKKKEKNSSPISETSNQLAEKYFTLLQKDVDNPGSKINLTKRNKVLKMLITIVAVFAISWLPIQLFNIFIYFSPNFLQVNSPTKYYCFVFTYFLCHWISCAHSFMNAIILLISKNFQADFRQIFCRFSVAQQNQTRISRQNCHHSTPIGKTYQYASHPPSPPSPSPPTESLNIKHCYLMNNNASPAYFTTLSNSIVNNNSISHV